MSAIALWAPLEVPDFDAAAAFYGELLGLPRIDAWNRDGERGAVFGVGASGRIEIVQTNSPDGPPSIALELPSRAEVDAVHVAVSSQELVLEAQVFPRGHYGFVVRDPAGNGVMIWSEAGA